MLRCGLFGAGRIGQVHAASIAAHPRAELGWVCDPFAAAGANLVADYIAQAGDIDSAMVLLRAADGALAQITNSRRCSFGYDQQLEAFGATGMLMAANQLPTSVRYYWASRTESASPYVNFFLERYTPAYRAELDHFITSIEQGSEPEPGFADGRAALAPADAANESLRTGRTVFLG